MDRVANIDDLKIDRPVPRRRAGRRMPWLLGAVAAILVLAGVGWRQWGRMPTNTSAGFHATSTTTRPLMPTETGSFSAGGYLEVIPPGPLVVSAMVEGRVQSLAAIEGQSVEKGQEVAKLDDALHRRDVEVQESAIALSRAKLARLEAGFRPEEIEQAKAELEKSQAQREQAQLNLDRLRKVLETSAASQKEYEDARYELAAATADVAARKSEYDLRKSGTRKEDISVARAELAAAEADLARAKWKLDACSIRVPVSGVVLEHFAQVGDWLAPGDGRERSAAILSVVDPKRIQAWADVNQRDFGRVSAGQRVLLTTDAQPDRQIPGRVVQILPKANLQKNTVQVKVAIPDPPPDLRPEMSVKVTFLSPQERKSNEVQSR